MANYNPLVIAAIVPIGGNKEVAQEMLRGVAQAQDNVNKKYLSDCINDETNKSIKDCNKGIKGKPLQVMIGNDDNNREIAVDIARYLIKEKKEILAVIGHNASEVSTETAKEYQKGRLVMMTPTSFALDFNAISTQNNPRENFIFSVAPNVEHIVPRLIEKMAEKYINKEALEKPKIIICYDQYSFDQKIFRPAFLNYKKTIDGEDLSVIDVLDIDCDFSEKLDIQKTFESGREQSADTLFLAPHVNKIGDTITVLKTIMQDDRYKHI